MDNKKDNKKSKCYADKLKQIRNKADTLTGCVNRMCITDDRDELFNMYAYLTLHASKLYQLNLDRLFIAEYGTDRHPPINL